MAIIENITEVVIAVSFMLFNNELIVSYLYIKKPINIAHIPETAADSDGVSSPP